MSISIWLSDAVDNRLENLAAVTGHSKTFFVAQAMQEYLDEVENLYIAEHELTAIYADAGRMNAHAEHSS
jgi:RHH-type rel operon transcriptional repressor/antitoxin RelB